MASRFTTDCEGFHRRDFLKIGAAGLFGLTLPQLLRLESQAKAAESAGGLKRRADAVIMLWLGGGPATIDMWDLKPNAPTEIRGEFKPIATSADGVQICEHLPKTAKVCDRGHHRPVAEPHHPVARPRHGLHADRQQADAGHAISRSSAR